MEDKDLIQITISKFIPAQKWKVIRMVTKVSDFPSYVPNVKEASILTKSRNSMTTKWRVQLDNVPITWTENDTLMLNNDTIHFQAIEGDLKEFYGDWIFKTRDEGTEVTVNVYLRVGIPAIGEFADAYIKKILAGNFEAILDITERRLISIKYAGFKKGEHDKIAGFGIIGHLYNFYHLAECLKMLNPAFKMPSREFLGQLFHLTPSFKLYDILNFHSKAGAHTKGCFVVATFIPDMIEKDIWTIFSKVVRACKIAEKSGVGIVTLGGFTSIVAERVGHEVASEVDVAVTTGNTFTAAMAIDGVEKACALLNRDISTLKLAIVGGTGDIGSACARVLVNKVKRLVITGRTKSSLVSLSRELAKKRKAGVEATRDNFAAVKNADIVISAASATSSILKADWFKRGAIICDIGYPKNISYTPTNRQDILIFSGGLAKSPTPLALPINIGLPGADTIYGCFSESIILSLEKRYENFSFGRGHITPERIEEIRGLGRKHGFEVSDFYWGNAPVTEEVLERVREAIKTGGRV